MDKVPKLLERLIINKNKHEIEIKSLILKQANQVVAADIKNLFAFYPRDIKDLNKTNKYFQIKNAIFNAEIIKKTTKLEYH